MKYLGIIATALLLLLTSNVSLAEPLKPLPVEQAFQFSAMLFDSQTVTFAWKITPGYFLYKDRFQFKSSDPKVKLGEPLFPPSTTKYNREIGEYRVFKENIHISIPLIASAKKTVPLIVTYQGCSAAGYCYPPVQKEVALDLSGPYQTPIAGITVQKKLPTVAPLTIQTNAFEKLLDGKHLILLIFSFLGIGVLIAFTPCCLPMIPILSAIIIGQEKIHTKRSVLLSISYVLGMALTYAAAGMLFAFLGGSVQAVFQKPWIIVVMSLIFVALAFASFGFYNLQLPESVRVFIAAANNKVRRGSVLSTFIMGALSILILSPCVTPPLVGVLGYISQTGNILTGGLALFSMALGMGIPLLILAVAGSRFLPKSGRWMNTVKNLLGVLLLAMAIWLPTRASAGKST